MKNITKIKYNEGLRWMPFDVLHAKIIQKHASVTEGGWNRMRDWAGMLGECNSRVLGVFSTPKHDSSKNRGRGLLVPQGRQHCQ
jgi:hypothetical protein